MRWPGYEKQHKARARLCSTVNRKGLAEMCGDMSRNGKATNRFALLWKCVEKRGRER